MILPVTNHPFEWRATELGPMLVCTALESIVRHGFTTRHWTIGQAVGLEGEARERRDREGWDEISRAMTVPRGKLVRMQQVHGASIAVADAALDPPVADIVVSNDPTLALAVQAADCVPLLLADRVTGAVAAAHAGWRGLAAGVPRIAVEALVERFATRVQDVIAVCGPSIGACCYEVGPDVRHAFREGFDATSVDRWFLDRPLILSANPSLKTLPATLRSGHAYFDGWACVRDQLLAAGLESQAIFQPGLCTASHPGTLCSYRRDGAPAGRLIGAIRTL